MKRIVVLLCFVFFSCLCFVSSQGIVTGNAISGSVSLTFSTGSNGWTCVSGQDLAFWQNDTNEFDTVTIYNSTYSSKNVCDNTSYSSIWCCPQGYIRYRDSKSGDSECVVGVIPPELVGCAAFTDEITCNNSAPSFAFSAIGQLTGDEFRCLSNEVSYFNGVLQCTNYTSCACAWNRTLGKCMANLYEEQCCGNIVNDVCDIFISTSCSWYEKPNSRQDFCNTSGGKIILTYQAISSSSAPNSECVDQVIEYPCSISVKLPFFSWFNFTVSVSGIAMIYFLMRRK